MTRVEEIRDYMYSFLSWHDDTPTIRQISDGTGLDMGIVNVAIYKMIKSGEIRRKVKGKNFVLLKKL